MVGCPTSSGVSTWCDGLPTDEIGLFVVTFDGDDQFNVVQSVDGVDETDGEPYADFREELRNATP